MNIVTHNGPFHIDDLCAVSLALLVYKDAQVIRTRDEEIIKNADMVIDVGREYDPARLRFDHHQRGGAGEREGIPYASAGLVWKEFGEILSGSKDAMLRIDNRLMKWIDAEDNGVETYIEKPGVRPYTFGTYIFAHIPSRGQTLEDADRSFRDHIPLMQDLLQAEIARAQEWLFSKEKMSALYSSASDKRLIIMDDRYQWRETLMQHPEPLYLVSPDMEPGKWTLRAIPKTLVGFESRKPLPEEWRGLEGDELRKVTGEPDAVFCHRSGHVLYASSKESVLRLAEKALL